MKEIWTIGRVLKWTTEYLASKGVETARLDTEVLLSHVLQKPRIYLYVHFDEPLQKGELAVLRELIKKRAARMPVSHILGRREFMGLTFKVTTDTLSPRPETEILVEAAKNRLKNEIAATEPVIFADIGTGTGAIALSLLNLLSEARAVAVDISPTALAVAKENAENLGLSERVEFLPGDLTAPLGSRRFAAILANPPYIPEHEIEGLSPEVKNYDPRLALAGGQDGLDFYRRLVAEGQKNLLPGGFMAFEVGLGQAEKVRGLATQAGGLRDSQILPDYAGIPRVVVLQY
ncbi:MAG: peptide chain release factor N(5)-glutamine methyltransferase [Selenomonadaceae bacterium]|nr:peptide chain release factor N(5)-glutamine methyltransferase [Selenomonadaceae bacterium]